ncbi:16S rRNA (cytidine(1402)-2'-O)-methyltransferase [Spiroplasma endosymbiont of Labia minor]|uniref:16S rRNA (cytidine(1402)-2'-O)-methyltransferase n=1 Tax=Spiroplasma endosymbiont of Labia minor TaxID=3066305 RepID=UPI0030D08428
MIIFSTFKDNKPILFLVTTPIGNLNDISNRAIDTLKIVDIILCEDTRQSMILLQKYNIKKPLISLHKYNEIEKAKKINDYLILKKNIALISDAGVPVISDPGSYLLNELYKMNNDFSVCPIGAGPAYIHALIISGWINKNNYFGGFLPHKTSEIIKEFKKIKKFDMTTVCYYESVHRILSTISLAKQILGNDTKIIIGREITKINEQFIIGTLAEIDQYFNFENKSVIKGEFVILFTDFEKNTVNEEIIKLKISEYKLQNKNNKEIISIIIDEFKLSKNYISNLVYKS